MSLDFTTDGVILSFNFIVSEIWYFQPNEVLTSQELPELELPTVELGQDAIRSHVTRLS